MPHQKSHAKKRNILIDNLKFHLCCPKKVVQSVNQNSFLHEISDKILYLLQSCTYNSSSQEVYLTFQKCHFDLVMKTVSCFGNVIWIEIGCSNYAKSCSDTLCSINYSFNKFTLNIVKYSLRIFLIK